MEIALFQGTSPTSTIYYEYAGNRHEKHVSIENTVHNVVFGERTTLDQ